MDFLDPKKQRAHAIRLMVGYVLIGLTLITATAILLYSAYGFDLKNGEVIQNGLIFLSSTPPKADIYLNGQKYKNQTNQRLNLPAGQYTVELRRDGYQSWKRAITIEGGSVANFSYPLLVPTKLTPVTLKKYDAKPQFISLTPDHRWLVVQNPAQFASFDVYDLNATNPVPQTITLPASVATSAEGDHLWQIVDWAGDNRHLLMRHIFNGTKQSEYVMLDRQDVAHSINLSQTLPINNEIVLRDSNYDQYYVYNPTNWTLYTASLKKPTPEVYLQHVLAYKPHGTLMLYVTDQESSVGKANVRLRDGDNNYTIRQVSISPHYLLDIAQYNGSWWLAAGGQADNHTYVYKDPEAALQDHPQDVLTPVQIMKVAGAQYLSFSDNARFVMEENGNNFAVYDVENDKGYAYNLKTPLDAGVEHVAWIDGFHLGGFTDGKALVFDFDDSNQQILTAGQPSASVKFGRDMKKYYTVGTEPNAVDANKAQFLLQATNLLTPADQ